MAKTGLTHKKLATKLHMLADEMQEWFDDMDDAEYGKADALSLATLQGDLYSWSEEIKDGWDNN